jgi:hypothetical protein
VNPSKQMMYDDLFFAPLIIAISVYGSYLNWNESDWLGLLGTILLFLLGIFWLSARIYHLTHQNETFGKENISE